MGDDSDYEPWAGRMFCEMGGREYRGNGVWVLHS